MASYKIKKFAPHRHGRQQRHDCGSPRRTTDAVFDRSGGNALVAEMAAPAMAEAPMAEAVMIEAPMIEAVVEAPTAEPAMVKAVVKALMAEAAMVKAVVKALMAEAAMVKAMVEALMAEPAMECGPEQKERPGADEAAIWVRAVIWIAAGIDVGVVARIAVARRRRLDDVAPTRHALAIGGVVLRLRSSGNGAGIARADCGAGQQPGAGADRGPRTRIAARLTHQRTGRGADGGSHGGAAHR